MQLVQVRIDSYYWNDGSADADGNFDYNVWIDLNQIIDTNGHIYNNRLQQIQVTAYGVDVVQQPLVFQVLTDDLLGLRTDIAAYVASLNPPTDVAVPVYEFAIDVV